MRPESVLPTGSQVDPEATSEKQDSKNSHLKNPNKKPETVNAF